MEDVNVIPLTAKDAQECVEKCCDMGPKQCQYIWVFKNSCFAVSCSVEVANLCEPQLAMNKDATQSSYYEIVHPFIHNLKSTFDDGQLCICIRKSCSGCIHFRHANCPE